MHDVAQPLIARLRHLPHLAAPPDLRPGGSARPPPRRRVASDLLQGSYGRLRHSLR
jgi:hypothetical protein